MSFNSGEKMIAKIRENAEEVEQTVGYKLNNGLARLEDEEEACTRAKWAYLFAREIEGANIERCEEAACKDPWGAYAFAKDIPRANIGKCQEAACKDPEWAYYFAKDIPGANIEKCCEAACKDPALAWRFADDFPENIERCEEMVCKDPFWAYQFAYYVKGANIEKCKKVCKGTEYEFYKWPEE